MTHGSTSTRWSRRSARPRGAPTALARMLPTGKKPSARAGMFSPLRSRAASPAATAPRAWQSRAARNATPPAASASWIRSRRGRRRCCCWKGQPPRSAAAHRLTRCAALWRSCNGTRACSFPWSRCTISRKTGASASSRRRRRACSASAPSDRRARRERSRCSASAAARGKRRNFYCRRWSGSATRAAACASGIAGTPRFRWSCIRSSAAAFPMPMCGGIRSGACAATMPSAAAS